MGTNKAALAAERCSPRIEVVRYPALTLRQNDRVDISVGVDINAAHELNDLAKSRPGSEHGSCRGFHL